MVTSTNWLSRLQSTSGVDVGGISVGELVGRLVGGMVGTAVAIVVSVTNSFNAEVDVLLGLISDG